MLRHTTIVQPTTSTHIGTHMRWRIVTLTKKMMKNKESSNSNSHSSLSSQVSIDTEKLKKGMAAILPLGDFDTKGVTTDFTTNPHVIPPDLEDQPLLKSDQAALMCLP